MTDISQEDNLKKYVEEQEQEIKDYVGPKLSEAPKPKLPHENTRALGNQLGWIPIKIEDLPTRGLFYPKNTELAIRSATGAEIRHWSTLQEDDLSMLDDMLNYVIERCVTLKGSTPESVYISWKDIKEVDRFYLLLAIQELTFAQGENKLQVKISDTKKINVTKDMVSYISLDPKIMKYYDEEERCFVMKFKTGKSIKLDIPSVGVTQWLKSYIMRKQRAQEYIEEDYLSYASFIIRSWRGLTDEVYNSYLEQFQRWDIGTTSLMVEFKKIFSDTINPVIKYLDEGGVEQTAPLNFQGGVKSIFIIHDIFGQLE